MASATVNAIQQVGGSVGKALLSTIGLISGLLVRNGKLAAAQGTPAMAH